MRKSIFPFVIIASLVSCSGEVDSSNASDSSSSPSSDTSSPYSSDTSTSSPSSSSQTPFESNLSFEIGDFTGFERTGSAFSDTTLQIAGSDSKKIHVDGNFYVDGSYGISGSIGTLTSNYFTLTGTGYISYLLGGGKDNSLCYVALLDQEGNVLKRQGNLLFNTVTPNNRMYRQVMDVRDYLGQSVAISFIDEDTSIDYGYLLIDGIVLNASSDDSDAGTLIDDARRYKEEYTSTITSTYRHTYHFSPSIGWMNDPNGFVYYDGEYHLFYQHNPYSAAWDSMHWGHATSKDLIVWKDVEVALAPDQTYDLNGCFSGGAIVDDDKLHLLYTAVGDGGIQQQALATSYDGINFTKRTSNPVISSNQRGNARITDFRDPYLFEKDGTYYALIGGKLEGNGGEIGLYSSSNLLNWRRVGTSFSSEITGTGMFECPNYASLSGSDIILSSPQSVRSNDIATYQNLHSVTYQVGDLDFSNGVFTNAVEDAHMEEFDKGFDFYATQTLERDGVTYMVAWMDMWSRSYPSSIYGWTGEVTLPRVLSLVDGHIYQAPIPAIENYYVSGSTIDELTISSESYDTGINDTAAHFEFDIDVSSLSSGQAGIELFKGSEETTKVYYDASTGLVVFDRKNSGRNVVADDPGTDGIRYARVSPNESGIIHFEIFIDVSSVEVFINDGYYTMSGLVYPSADSTGVNLFSDGGNATFSSFTYNSIEVN